MATVPDRRDARLDDGFARRALAAARGLEDDGQYSAAKIFRAAALAAAWRATRERPRTGAAREQAMEEVAAAWRAAHGDDALAVAMDRALANYRAGARWQTLEEAPQVFVCRECGEVALAAPPAACLGCGARPLTFYEVLPIHFLEPLAADALLAALALTPVEVARLCRAAADDGLVAAAWSPRDIVRHLIFAEEVFVGRAWRMLDEDEPYIEPIAPPVSAAGEGTLAELVAAFVAARERTLARLRGLSAEAWERSGFHPEWGPLTVRLQLGYLARHEHGHLAELEVACGTGR